MTTRQIKSWLSIRPLVRLLVQGKRQVVWVHGERVEACPRDPIYVYVWFDKGAVLLGKKVRSCGPKKVHAEVACQTLSVRYLAKHGLGE